MFKSSQNSQSLELMYRPAPPGTTQQSCTKQDYFSTKCRSELTKANHMAALACKWTPGRVAKKGKNNLQLNQYKHDTKMTKHPKQERNETEYVWSILCKSSTVYGCQTTLSLNLLTITEPMRRPCSNSLWKQQWDSEHLLACKMAQLKGSRDLWATGRKFTNQIWVWAPIVPNLETTQKNKLECHTENDRLWLHVTVIEWYLCIFVHTITHRKTCLRTSLTYGYISFEYRSKME